MARLIGIIVATALTLFGGGAVAQQNIVPSAVVELDREKLYGSTLYGQRIERDLGGASEALIAEHTMVQEELEAEEAELTAKRAIMGAGDFRVLADAFDEKATRVRAEREAKTRALQRRAMQEQAAFFTNVTPVVRQVMRKRGALVILDARAILMTSEEIDITDEVIAQVDTVIGDGAQFVAQEGRGEALKEDVDAPENGGASGTNGAAHPGLGLPLGEPLE